MDSDDVDLRANGIDTEDFCQPGDDNGSFDAGGFVSEESKISMRKSISLIMESIPRPSMGSRGTSTYLSTDLSLITKC